MQDGRRRLVRGITAGIAAALVAVPVAQARLAVDARHGSLLNRAPVVRTDARHAALLNKLPVRIEIVRPEPQSQNLPLGKTTATPISTGFDWGDAGIGAGSVLGLVLLTGGGLLVTRRRLVSA